MRRLLVGASSIALGAAIAAPGLAADWDVRVGGYYNAMVAYGTTGGNGVAGRDFDGVDVSTDTEIHFLPSITLDSGATIGANIQLEAETSGDQIDESYVEVSAAFGQILVGSKNSAGYRMTFTAPNAAIVKLNSPSTDHYIRWSGDADSVLRGTLASTTVEVGLNNDAKRITYFTPRFAGFQLGLSYAHDGNQDDFGPTNLGPVGTPNTVGPVGHIFDIGANYVGNFGDYRLAVSGRWGIGQQEINLGGAPSTANPTVWAAGVNLGYGGFTIGGSFAESNEHTATNGAPAGTDDGVAYDVGASYATGPWAFSLTYVHGENGEAGGTSDQQHTFGAGVDYKLAKGVRVNLFGAYVDYDAAAGPDSDVDGWVVGTGVGLSF